MLRKRISDEDIKKLLKDVLLDYLIEREGGLDAVNDWNDVLSGKIIPKRFILIFLRW